MEAFQQSLDALQRESNELITQCRDTMVAAVEKGNVAPSRVAVALAQRFTEERVASSFPVLSLIDFLLAQLAKAPPGPGQPASVALAAVLGEFWKLAPALFVFYAQVPEEGLKDKVLKRLRRWKQRNLLTEPTVGKLITATEEGPEKKQTTGGGSGEAALAEGGEGGAEGEAGSGKKRGEQAPFTHAQAHAFASVLRRCTSLLEQLPASRARPYFELIEQEHLTRPTAAAFVFFQDLLSELQEREANGSGKAGASGAAKGSSAEEQTDPSSPTSGNRAALGRLLDKFAANSGEDSGKDGAGAPTAAAVLKYTSPLFSDVHLRQPLPQRAGFALLAKRRLPSVVGGTGGGVAGAAVGGGGGEMYYPKKEATTRRPFRVPAALAQEGNAPVRTWFPTPQAWMAITDTAEAPMFASREEARITGGGWPGSAGAARKRMREEP